MAHKFAFESSVITAEAISAVVLVELAQNYKVMSTPHVVLNGMHHLKGWISEEHLLTAIQRRS